MQLTFTLSADDATRLTNALCWEYNYDAEIARTGSTETKSQFATRKFRELLKEKVRQYETWQAEQAIQVTDIGIT